MLLLPFFEIPYGEKVSKNVKKQYVQVLPRSTPQLSLGYYSTEAITQKYFLIPKIYG